MSQRAMDTRRSPVAGGIFVMIGMLGGFWFGAQQGQPSAGTVIGVGAGLAIAALIWAIDRRR